MEYSFYAVQRYTKKGLDAKVLNASEAAALGYEDNHTVRGREHITFVDGFDDKESAEAFLEDIIETTKAYEEGDGNAI